jgi:hypothetical protein
MYELALDHNSPLSIATYDPISGELYLEFNYDRLLDTQGEWSNGRHIDAVTFMGEVYPIIIHDDDGPRDANGQYIFDRDTVDNIFTINVGAGHDLSNGALEFGLSDREDGTGPLYSFVLEDDGTSTPQTYELTPTADDGIVTIDGIGEEDIVSFAGDSVEYDFGFISFFAMAQRALSTDVDTDYVVDDEGNEQVLLYTNSQPEGEVASYDELFAVLNVTDGFTRDGTSEADTFELTATADDGVVTVNDFSGEDTISIAGDNFSYDFDYLYNFAVNQRQISTDVDTNFVVADDGTEQILLFTNSNDDGEIAAYDELFAVLNVADEDDSAPTLVYALNAGGDAFLAANGVEYAADTFDNGRAFSTRADIAGTTDDSLYQTEKWAKTLSYETEVTNGTYDVELNLAEFWGGAQTAGKRVIDIYIEDELVFNDLDLADDAGFQTALDLVGQVTVEDGSLSIRATGEVQNAKLAGFAIWESEGALSETFEVGSLYDDLSF